MYYLPLVNVHVKVHAQIAQLFILPIVKCIKIQSINLACINLHYEQLGTIFIFHPSKCTFLPITQSRMTLSFCQLLVGLIRNSFSSDKFPATNCAFFPPFLPLKFFSVIVSIQLNKTRNDLNIEKSSFE